MERREIRTAPTAGGFARGNADALYRHRDFLRELGPDLVLVPAPGARLRPRVTDSGSRARQR